MTAPTTDDPKQLIVGIGEALFDCFEDHANLGGAPLNATLVAHALGTDFQLRGQMVSRVGQDDLGRQIDETLQQRKVDTSTIQIDPTAPTGRVNVQLFNGQPEYDIIENVAWDYIEWNDRIAKIAHQAAGVTFGTLAQRNPTSRETIWKFLETASSAIRFFDVNLRQKFFSTEILKTSCELANAVKLNKEELAVVSQHLQLNAADPGQHLLESYNLRAIVLTHGEKGTELITAAGRFKGPVPNYTPEEGSDPVGAGDACGATCLLGLILNWPPERIVNNANRVGAFVASRKGATPQIDACSLLTGQ